MEVLQITIHVVIWSTSICTTNTGEVSLSINGGTPNYNVYCNGGVFTGQNITNMAPGIYTYLIKDTIGCEFTGLDTIGIELIDLEFSYEETDDICDDEVGEITIVPTNGYAPYSYNWTINNPNSPTIANIGSGTYLAEVTDNYGCRGIAGTSIENVELYDSFFISTIETPFKRHELIDSAINTKIIFDVDSVIGLELLIKPYSIIMVKVWFQSINKVHYLN